ncbi:hypothetical protein HJC23_004695 [Cyclotella cryptica]|uniref:Uncharacterized protein n=1 Tax=Cyclotella cryptica TaxID=29204 RepID=A0ABD3PJK6_9STRA|eukprot:CCRYP_013909-RA/>CCRYP_013909-RA protein AED:0.23 eAED:0.23 QI:0/-1/0/1/-1/1/1/0/297
MEDTGLVTSTFFGIPPTITARAFDRELEACAYETLDKTLDDDLERVDKFGPDFLSQVCIDATKISRTAHVEASSSGSTTVTYSDSISTNSIHGLDVENISNGEDDCSIQSSTSTNSNKSTSSMDSTQLLLKQAHARIHRQSIYEEVQHLRTLVSGHETHSKLLARQKSNLLNKYKEIESLYTSALEQIHRFKLAQQQMKEEQAERELEYMNQMNEVCRTYDSKEQDYMGQLIQKDKIIVDLQNRVNELELGQQRERLRQNGKAVCDVVSEMETEIRMRDLRSVQGEESGDDSSCEYV